MDQSTVLKPQAPRFRKNISDRNIINLSVEVSDKVAVLEKARDKLSGIRGLVLDRYILGGGILFKKMLRIVKNA